MKAVTFGDWKIGGLSAEDWFERGVACERTDQLSDAVQAYRLATEIRPDFVEAWFNLGNLLRDAGALEQAEQAFRTAVRHRPRLAAGASAPRPGGPPATHSRLRPT